MSGFVFKDWYEQNKEDLNQSRRSRYKNDPSYREQVRKLNQESRTRRRDQKEKDRTERDKHIRNPVPENPWRTVDVPVAGDPVPVRLFTVGALAQRLGCSVQVVRLWEKSGVIPPTALRDSRGRRLYTAQAIEDLVRLVRARGRGKKNEGVLLSSRIRYVAVEVQDKGADDFHVLRMFRVGAMARVLQRSVLTLDQWDREGHLPPTPFRASSVGYRLYTVDMIRSVKEALDASGGVLRGDEAKRVFREGVEEAWRDQGVYNMTLIRVVRDSGSDGKEPCQNEKKKPKLARSKKPASN